MWVFIQRSQDVAHRSGDRGGIDERVLLETDAVEVYQLPPEDVRRCTDFVLGVDTPGRPRRHTPVVGGEVDASLDVHGEIRPEPGVYFHELGLAGLTVQDESHRSEAVPVEVSEEPEPLCP